MPVVLAISIVHLRKPAEVTCALIHVKMVIHVHVMPNVKLEIIGQFAFVQLTLSVIHLQIALLKILLANENVEPIPNARRQHRASIKVAVIHALSVIHAQEMQNVVYHNIVHYALAHWAGEAIHKYNVINVSNLNVILWIL